MKRLHFVPTYSRTNNPSGRNLMTTKLSVLKTAGCGLGFCIAFLTICEDQRAIAGIAQVNYLSKSESNRPFMVHNQVAGAENHDSPAAPAVVDMRKLSQPNDADPKLEAAPAPGIPDPAHRLVRDAKLDLGARLDLDISVIELADLASVTWPDSSLGCPQPGHVYSQVIVPGYRITLIANTREYLYHTDDKTQIVLCATPAK